MPSACARCIFVHAPPQAYVVGPNGALQPVFYSMPAQQSCAPVVVDSSFTYTPAADESQA